MNSFLRGTGSAALLVLVLVGVAWMCQRNFLEERRARQRVADVEKALVVHLANLPSLSSSAGSNASLTPDLATVAGRCNPGLWMMRTLKFERGIPRTHIKIPPDAEEPFRFLLGGNPPSVFEPLPPTSAIIREGNPPLPGVREGQKILPRRRSEPH